MNTLQFFNQNFGMHLVAQTGVAAVDAQVALSTGHKMAKGGPSQRIASGWAIVREGEATLQFKLASAGLKYSDATRYEAWLNAIEEFNGKPMMLLEFDKKPIPIINLRRTFDLRHICICSPGGVEVVDWTTAPLTKTHRTLVKLKSEKEKMQAKEAINTLQSVT